MLTQKKNRLLHGLWDLWCTLSIVGIWPRFVEPNLLSTTRLTLPIDNLPDHFHGKTILHFSDLHLHPGTSNYFVRKFLRRVRSLSPDLIVCTGDLLCRSTLPERQRLTTLLQQLHAPYGSYFAFGNHDYASYVSVDDQGDYATVDPTKASIVEGFQRLFGVQELTGEVAEHTHKIEKHEEFCALLAETSFQVLDNETKQIQIGEDRLNICGLGDYMLGRHCPEIAFEHYDERYPGIILCHNPDAAMHLEGYPGEIVLSGHTHGAQVYLPWMWKKFITLENPHLLRGLQEVKGKKIYINRGLGGVLPFRWFSVPEVLLLTLEKR